ncbi:DUF3572 domain-containing protein [Alsobacter sp. SYSU M60028]|uniref:DUF3572 domain-containing protein n=1 Tax=Alsobacter ponti TaxID=2962936 RepID=A0ABT1LEE4_9HYPH|nr:DUF3572 domain-containing protein [Alsobacter ponti]MCP8939872.1 DUF3572 domain-containing protein [Alsobacter ponti]
MNRPDRAQDAAQALAVEALGFLASDPERLTRFLDLTGLTPETVRRAAESPGFFVAVLDHLAGDESLLLTFAANADVPPQRVLAARDLLAGPNAMGLREG